MIYNDKYMIINGFLFMLGVILAIYTISMLPKILYLILSQWKWFIGGLFYIILGITVLAMGYGEWFIYISILLLAVKFTPAIKIESKEKEELLPE